MPAIGVRLHADLVPVGSAAGSGRFDALLVRTGPGQVRAAGSGKPSDGSKESSAKKNDVPAVVDVESSQQPPKPDDKEKSPGGGGSPRLGLPTTLLSGGGHRIFDALARHEL